LTDLRLALQQAYASAGPPALAPFTDLTIDPRATLIRLVHITELRAAIVALESR
jgi:hypothetical protein